MNENQQYQEEKNQEPDGKQVQQELERQLKEFGDTLSDAFRHGFEGRGEEIGDRVWDIGKATVNAANYGINAAGRAVREGQQAYQRQTEQNGTAAAWAKNFFAKKPDPTPVESLRISAKKRRGTGHALFWPGVTFAVIFAISAVSCFSAAAMFAPSMAGDAIATAMEGDAITQVVVAGGEAISSFAHGAIQISAWAFTVVTALFGWMTAAGVERLNASKRLNLYAEMAEGFDYKKGLSVEMMADLTHQKKQKALKLLRKYIRKGWLSAWLDEKEEKLYLTAEDYRAAQEAKRAEAEAAQTETAEEKAEDTAPLNLETARRFVQVLAQEKHLMQDENAVEELDQMQKTTAAICEWLEGHPESLPKARRFAEYYIPTTLKLLHTYNDVQGQQGENAESIRRDIAGILHTLNQAYRNLYDTLLGDVALDVSSEIAALQGMLANDGLTGGDFQ